MGRDKALLPFLGQTMIERIIARLSPAADEIIITTNHPDAYGFLKLPLLTDLQPNRGALGGLYTALKSARHPFVAVVACDMPFVNCALLTYQANILQKDEYDLVVPFINNTYEPLHTVYRRETCLPAVEWGLNHEEWRMVSWFSRVNIRTLLAEECTLFDPQCLAFSNINTPEEYALAQKVARDMEEG